MMRRRLQITLSDAATAKIIPETNVVPTLHSGLPTKADWWTEVTLPGDGRYRRFLLPDCVVSFVCFVLVTFL